MHLIMDLEKLLINVHLQLNSTLHKIANYLFYKNCILCIFVV